MLLTQQLHHNVDQEGGDEEEDGDLHRVEKSGAQHTFLTVAALLLTDVMRVLLRMPADAAFHHIDDETGNHAGGKFIGQHLQNKPGRGVFRDHDGQHLVRRGEEHRNKRASRDEPAGKEVCRGGGEAALGYHAQRAADGRPPCSRPVDQGDGLILRVVLNHLDEKIGQE